MVLDFGAQKVVQSDLPRAPHSTEKGPAWLLSWLSQNWGARKDTPPTPEPASRVWAGPRGPHMLVGSRGSSPGPGSHPLSAALLGPRPPSPCLATAHCPGHRPPCPPPCARAPDHVAPGAPHQHSEAPSSLTHQPLHPVTPPAGVGVRRGRRLDPCPPPSCVAGTAHAAEPGEGGEVRLGLRPGLPGARLRAPGREPGTWQGGSPPPPRGHCCGHHCGLVLPAHCQAPA